MPNLVPGHSPLVYQPHPFKQARIVSHIKPGHTVAEMVEEARIPRPLRGHLEITVGDEIIRRDLWDARTLVDGEVVYIRVLPQGGGGGKNILRTVLLIAVIVAATVAAPYLVAAMGITGTAALVATAAVSTTLITVGQLLVNALIPPPNPFDQLDKQLGAPAYQVTGSQNRLAPYQAIPRVFGNRRVYPMFAAQPYTESDGDNQYVRMLFLVGYGPLKIEDIKIGDTPLSSFNGVEVETTEGGPDGWSGNNTITLYTTDIDEQTLSVELTTAVSWETRVTEADTREVSIDITAPAGMIKYDDKGNPQNVDARFEVQYRAQGSTTWLVPSWLPISDDGFTSGGNIRIDEKTTRTVRRSGRFRTASAGTWEVRIRRVNGNISKGSDRTYWTALRSIKFQNPVNQPGVAMIAMRIKASEQLNGVPDSINCVATSYLPVWDGASWDFALTSNPAWAYTDLLRRRGPETLIADTRLDLESIKAWADACDVTEPNGTEAYWRFDAVLEGGAVFTALRTVASHGRAFPTMKDGKFSVVRDRAQTVPIQHITARNSNSYSGNKLFADLPHAIRVRFVNMDKGYTEDEVTAYDDGFSENNAERFETIELMGCTRRAQAWREGRYHLAVMRLRPEEHMVEMDIEAMRCTVGDYVLLNHDVISVGLGAGRIKSRTVNAQGRVTAFELDGPVTIPGGIACALRIRRRNGVTVLHALAQVPNDTTTTTLIPATYPTQSTAGSVGDLFMFGRSGLEAAPMIVKRIEAGRELTARLTLVDAQPGVWTADTGSIPPFQDYITIETPVAQRRPSAPTIALRSDEFAMARLADGTLQERLLVSIAPPIASAVPIDAFEVQFRETLSASWSGVGRYPFSQREVALVPVRTGVLYDVRVRSLSKYGVASDWTTITEHEVTGKTTVPPPPSSLVATGGYRQISISWDNPEILDYSATRLFENTTDNLATATQIAIVRGTAYIRTGLSDGVTRYYWAKTVDTTELVSEPNLASGTVATTDSAIQAQSVEIVFRRSATQPSTPSPSINAPSGWVNNLSSLPSGSDPIWSSFGTRLNLGSTITWQTPVKVTGEDGQPGTSVSEVSIFRRSASQPTTPTGGSFAFSDLTLTAPAGWSNGIPSGTDPVWISRAVAAVSIPGGTDSSLTWSQPILTYQDGTSPLLGYLTNESATVAADSSGNVLNFNNANGNFKVFDGSTDVSSQATYTVGSSSGVVVTINSSGYYAATSMSSDSGFAPLRASYGGTTIEKIFSIAKARGGAAATILSLKATAQTFRFEADGTASPTSQTITFTAALANLSGTPTFTATKYNAAGQSLGTVTLGGSGTTRTLTVAQFANSEYLVVVASLSGATDQITVYRIDNGRDGTDGADGADGAPGEPAKVLLVSASSQVFQINKSGSATPSSVTLTAYGQNLTGNPVFTVTSGTATLTGSGTSRTLTYSNMGSDAVQVQVAQNDLTDTITIVKVREGQDALVGFLTNESAVVAADASGTVASFATAGGTFSVFQGVTDYTGNGPTYSVVSTDQVTISINSTTGVYTVTNLTADSGTATLRASFAGASITKIYSIAKSKAGANGADGVDGVDGAPGAAGLSVAELSIFRRSASQPSTPTGGTYNFGTKSLSAPSGWSTTVPSGSDPVWISRATASVQGTTGSVSVSGWSTPAISFQNGEKGDAGSAGVNGERGSRHIYLSGYSFWSDSAANNAFAVQYGGKVLNDVATLYGSSFSQTRSWNGSSWITIEEVIDGNLLVSGSIGADKLVAGEIITNAAQIRDGIITNAKIGNIIQSTNYSAGSSGWQINKDGNAEFNNITVRGNLRSSNLFTGSLYKDAVSNQQILSMAATTHINGYVADAGAVAKMYTSSEMRIYGPNWHSGVPVNQRARSTNAGNNLFVTVMVNAIVDHYMTLWYRYNTSQPGVWLVLAETVEPQSNDGTVAISRTAELGLSDHEYIELGITSTTSSNVLWNSGRPYLRYLYASILVNNL